MHTTTCIGKQLYLHKKGKDGYHQYRVHAVLEGRGKNLHPLELKGPDPEIKGFDPEVDGGETK